MIFFDYKTLCAYNLVLVINLECSNEKNAIGTASSLFGFFYYCMISFFTFFMGFLHDGTLLPMPLYFLSLSLFMMIVNRIFLKS
jgi:O-antigen ligase